MPRTDYSIPGVYVEEVSKGPRPIESVGTDIAAFVGRAPNAAAERHRAVPVNNWAQFVRTYCPEGAETTPLAQAVYGFFENGGQRCFVVNVGPDSIAGGIKAGARYGIATLEERGEVAIVAAPGYADAESWNVVLSHCQNMKDRFAVLDCPEDVTDISNLTEVATAAPPGRPPAGGEGGASKGQRPASNPYAAFYYPWITIVDPLSGQRVYAPPSGHIAGVYARTDATRGVHKAPANEAILGALDVKYRVTPQEQGVLNPAGVNVIRFFPDAGIRVWGARTLEEKGGEWRYINVRRLFNMVEESIAQATRWVVFEPNDQTLWKSIRRDVGAYLTRLWRSGALFGATPEQAFFVKCDEETNPPDVIDAGMLVIEIGIAPVKPAEFVIFRIGQHQAGTEKKEGSNA